MGHRALVAYERPDEESYNLHYSHWGALNLRLKHELTAETPFGGPDDDTEWACELLDELLELAGDRTIGGHCPDEDPTTTVDPQPWAIDVSFEDIITDHLDYLHHEALYVVETDFTVTAYRTFWFGLQYDCETIEDAPTVGNGALRTVRWHDSEPVNDGYVRGQFQALKAITGDMLDWGVFDHAAAIDYLTGTFAEWTGDRRDLIVRTP